MEAMGLVNNHARDCFVRDQVEAVRTAFERPSAGV
jgi:hypothetical protein